MRLVSALCLPVLLLLAGGARGAEDLAARFSQRLEGLVPDPTVSEVRPTAIPGIHEVHVGADLLYMSEDGRFVMRGDLYDLEARQNLTEQRRGGLRLEAFAALGAENMVEFAPADAKPKHVIYVFTDVDCGYCRKLHQEVGELTAAGVAVRYITYPRGGLDSESYRTMVSVWCADDRKAALTTAKNGGSVPAKTCDNPVKRHFELGNQLGVRGTPTIILEDGRELGGYAPAAQLVQLLDQQP